MIENLQTFLKIKVVKQPNIGRLFEFFEESKEHYGIQQYTIKQASVEQIFNRFAEIGD
jgi:ATP-binding cassette subfamily A (ABC1) protein 3